MSCFRDSVLTETDSYFSLRRRLTKSALGAVTTPFFLMLRLRFFDFLVRMWRLKAFWKVISPVPVTLNLFFALELVLTFGILCNVCHETLLAPRTGGNLWSRLGNACF